MMLATVATINRAVQYQCGELIQAKRELTIGDVEDDGSTNEKADDLDSIANRLELSSHGG